MLVLTRRNGESIVIGDNIKLTIVSVGPGRVKIGIDAPPSVRVDRSEIHARIASEKAADVLEAVSSIAAGTSAETSDPATMVAAGPETNLLHNRIADQLPPTPNTVPGSPVSTTPPENSIRKYRSPRKPR